MKENIYLVASKRKVERMTKNLPNVYKGEIVIKLTVNVNDKAFGEPVIAQEIFIDEWTQGIDMEDVEFNKNIISKEEAEIIKQKRLEKMKSILESQGYSISKDDEEFGLPGSEESGGGR